MGGHGAAIFVGDAPGLDFLNSVATPADTTIDWIDDGAGLLSWLEQAQLVPAEVLRKIQAQAGSGELDEIARQARGLREWFRRYELTHQARALELAYPEKREPVNRPLSRDQ